MSAEIATSVDDAITSRQSARRFLDKPVTREQIAHLLDVARFAPSGTNTQPWRVYVVNGAQIVNGTLNVNETVKLAEQAVDELLLQERAPSPETQIA